MATHLAGQVVHLVITTLVLSLALFAYERSIEPLYGSVSTAYYLAHVLYGASTIAYFAPAPSLAVSQFILAALLCAAPTTTYWVAVLTGRYGDPKLGPLVTHLLVVAPIFLVGTSMHLNVSPYSVFRILHFETGKSMFKGCLMLFEACLVVGEPCRINNSYFISQSRLIPSSPPALEFGVKSQLFYYVPFLAVRMYLSQNPGLQSLPEDVVLLALGALSLIMWRITTFMSKLEAHQGHVQSNTGYFNILVLIAAVIIPTMRAPTLRHPLSEPYDHPKFPLRIISSVQSTTGLVVVGEALPLAINDSITAIQSMRYLRASHSLLGGVWIGDRVVTSNDAPPVVDSQGTPLGDSVYAAFVLQEAVRLVDSTELGKDGKWKNTLIIGLGTGISASAFSRHNISTTIVEIDPAVYAAARQYFGLPDPGPNKVFLEDAKGWVTRKRESLATDIERKQELYDIVVHDCFSGGAVPKHIFTLEFWDDLKTIMNPEGVIAVNFAGRASSNSSHAILHTLQKSFGRCRVFHDALQELTEEQYKNEFINMVIFCSVSPRPLSFRPAVESDYLNSYLRERVLSSLPDREVDVVRITGDSSLVPGGDDDKWLLTDLRNPLDEWQKTEALEHWKVMRQVLPDIFWETY